MKITSYNIQYGKGKDGRFDLARIADAVRDADIIGLQEVTRNLPGVPPELADVIRPKLTGVVEEIITAVRAEVPEYDQPMEGEFGRLISEGSGAALRQFVDLLGHDTDLGDVSVYEEMGRAELRAGRTLDALQSAYRIGARQFHREPYTRRAALRQARSREVPRERRHFESQASLRRFWQGCARQRRCAGG